MAKKARKTNKRAWKSWTAEAIKELRGHSKAKTPVAKLEKLFKLCLHPSPKSLCSWTVARASAAKEAHLGTPNAV